MTLAETILEISKQHVKDGGLIMGQNLEAIQNVCGTVPVGEPGVQIMPTCEAAGIGMAIGAALSGRPVIHVIRFASFLWLQSSPLIYYAAKAKEIWGYDLPLFIRVSSDDDIGPTHSGANHSPFIGSGLKVVAPMTPGEYRATWREFTESRQPVLVSEHRTSYARSMPMIDSVVTGHGAGEPKIVIVAISAARFAAEHAALMLAQAQISATVFHVWELSHPPIPLTVAVKHWALKTKRVLIVDSAPTVLSSAEDIGFRLCQDGGDIKVDLLGLKNNKTPTAEEIYKKALEMIR